MSVSFTVSSLGDYELHQHCEFNPKTESRNKECSLLESIRGRNCKALLQIIPIPSEIEHRGIAKVSFFIVMAACVKAPGHENILKCPQRKNNPSLIR